MFNLKKFVVRFWILDFKKFKVQFQTQGRTQPQKKGDDTIPTSFQTWGGKQSSHLFCKPPRPVVPKLATAPPWCAAKTCVSCCIYCFPHKNYNVKVVSSFLQFYSVW